MEYKLRNLIQNSKKKVLAVYFTAGFPKVDSTIKIMNELAEAGADLVEVGIPFSDSLVDGPTIQESNGVALANGMNLEKLLSELKANKEKIRANFVLMGSYNPIIQYGMERFVKDAVAAGALGVIIPDLPPDIYTYKNNDNFKRSYQELFEENNLAICFLVTAHTPLERVRYLDSLTSGFIYAVSSDATTGSKFILDDSRRKYFQALKEAKLNNPVLVGFGISDRATFTAATEISDGAIVGSAFIRELQKGQEISSFIKALIVGEY